MMFEMASCSGSASAVREVPNSSRSRAAFRRAVPRRAKRVALPKNIGLFVPGDPKASPRLVIAYGLTLPAVPVTAE